MSRERVEFGVVRSKCNCPDCVDNCKHMPGYLKPTDLRRMIPPGAIPEEWAREHLRASKASARFVRIHADGRREPHVVNTLVPASAEGRLACHWLKQGHCLVHSIAPFGCALFSCKQTAEEANRLSALGLREIEDDSEADGLYTRLWTMLWDAGLRSTDVAIKRAALLASYRERQQQQQHRKRPHIPGSLHRK